MSITGLLFLFCAIHPEGKSLESVVGFVEPISLMPAAFHIGGPWWSLTLCRGLVCTDLSRALFEKGPGVQGQASAVLCPMGIVMVPGNPSRN